MYVQDKMWSLTWILLLIFTSLSFTAGNIDICRDQNEEERTVNIYGVYNRVLVGCMCVVTLRSSSARFGYIHVKSNINPLGCEYRLRFIQQLYPNNPYLYDGCRDYDGNKFNLQANTERLYIDVVRGPKPDGGLVFNISLSTSQGRPTVRAKCGPPESFTQPLPLSTYSIYRTTSDISDTTTSSGVDNAASTINPGSTSPATTQIATSTVVNGTETESPHKPFQDDSLPVIIGSAVGGTVFIVVCLIIIVCLIKRKKSKKMVESENTNLTDVSNGYQHVHSTTDSLGYETVEHSPDGRPQITDTPEMEIIPNELYCSSDSLAQLDQPELESTPNPSVEYAVVQKKLNDKPQISNDSKALKPAIATKPQKKKKIKEEDYENIPKVKFDLKPEVDRIVGPEGDEYTLVNKS